MERNRAGIAIRLLPCTSAEEENQRLAPLRVTWPVSWVTVKRRPALLFATAGVLLIGSMSVGLFSSISCTGGRVNPTAVPSGTTSNLGSGPTPSEQGLPTAPAAVPLLATVQANEGTESTPLGGTARPPQIASEPSSTAVAAPEKASQSSLPTVASLASLEVGTTAGVPGEQVTLPIYLHTGGTAVRGVRLNLVYDGNTLTHAQGSAGVDLPPRWTLASNSPGPGDLRFLALDFAGQPFSGMVFTATFTIDAAATAGDVAVIVALEEVRDGSNLELSLGVTSGVVTVRSPDG